MTMKRLKRLLSLCLVICMCLSLFACGKKNNEEPTAASSPDGSYTVTISTESGMPLQGIGVYIYTDATQADLVWFAKTDAAGQISFSDTSSKSYVAVLKDVPAGFIVEDSYVITGADTQIKLAMELIDEDALAGITVNLGDAMFDFAVTDTEGTEYKLSDLLKEKDAVVLNFWYVECAPCKMEFPYLQEAYEEYSDRVAVLALNPVNPDEASVAAFKEEMGLTFPVAQCSNSWESAMQLNAYPTTVVIDRYGMISFMHTGSITDTDAFADMFAYFTAEDYEHTVVENLEDLLSEKDEDEFQNPTDVGGVTSFDVQVEPGKVVYVNVYKLIGIRYVTIKDPDAYVIYNNKTYSPTNGTVSLSITSPDVTTAAVLGFGNSGDETKIFTVNFAMPAGTLGNPYTMNMGEFTVKVHAGNEQGVYYVCRAAESGILTVECTSASAGVPYGYTLYNLSSGAYRTLSDDGKLSTDGNPSLSVKVTAGQQVQLIVSTLPDSSGAYPAGTFKFNAAIGEDDGSLDGEQVEKIVYSVTVTDENRAPVSGAAVYLDVEGSSVLLTSDATGVAATKLVPGTYPVTLKFPAGYTGTNSQFVLTEAIPHISVKLEKKLVEMTDYTVTVVDESGNPISGALVSMGGTFGYTDATGQLVLNLDKAEHTAYIVAEGYADNSVVFENGETAMTVTMTKGTGTVTGIDYTVKIVDYSGNPVKDVSVAFLNADGSMAAMKVAGADGTVTQKLPEGTYTLDLAFSGASWYDASKAVLDVKNTSVTVTAYDKCNTEEGSELFVSGNSVGNAYFVNVGATYIYGMQSNVYNYYLFEPTVAGLYQVTATDPSVKVSNWGATTFPMLVEENAENTFNINVKESMLGNILVIGVTGCSEGVLVLTRIGDPILDETDIVPVVYEGQGAPTTVYKVTEGANKTLTYFDMTAAGYTLVRDANGDYHLDSVNGPKVYVHLGFGAPYISLAEMLGVGTQFGTSFNKTFYDENGVAYARESYGDLMTEYCKMVDTTYKVYPLNDDLIYMLQQGGSHKGWWDSTHPNFLFTDVEGFNPEIGWMFAFCYFK